MMDFLNKSCILLLEMDAHIIQCPKKSHMCFVKVDFVSTMSADSEIMQLTI